MKIDATQYVAGFHRVFATVQIGGKWMYIDWIGMVGDYSTIK